MSKKILLALLGILISDAALADMLDTREKAVVAKKVEINQVNAALGQYVNVKDQYFYGDQGLIKRNQAFFTQVAAWINNWKQGMELADVGSSGQIPGAMVEIETLIRNQRIALDSLIAQSRQIQNIGADSISQAEVVTMLPINLLAEYPGIAEGVAQYGQALNNSVVDIRNLAADSIAELEQIYHYSPRALRAKMKSNLTARGIPVADALAKFDDLILYEAEIEPLLLELESVENAIDAYALEFAWFQATSELERGQLLCSQVQAKINSSSVSSARAQKATQRQSSLCNTMVSLVDGLSNTGLSKAEMAYEYGQMNNFMYAEQCREVESSVDCEKLAVLRGISYDSVMSMSDDELRFYELGWSSLQKAN
ncbi:hypothetical protein [Gynuella sunshinyii]|uniref:Uncharacterized protein n=1 Tax=Gynuella sunshinyii YC6258 TaxID=1445510 RepID=A0A0C5VX93_9GAMM|nr:hypothetical protein [Gynuella sunshinyii]AJQ97953.1 hypothetical Protein YC6258_05929 [Gynuella sunshinyii YC6258]